jgi:hypothetical protein
MFIGRIVEPLPWRQHAIRHSYTLIYMR